MRTSDLQSAAPPLIWRFAAERSQNRHKRPRLTDRKGAPDPTLNRGEGTRIPPIFMIGNAVPRGTIARRFQAAAWRAELVESLDC